MTTFHRLFAEGGADQLSSVTALGLFDEFRELTPTGEEGDQLVRRFAERLASVDLLDEAARLLEQQVKLRLKGEEKARIGLRAAELRLADRKPEVALTALADSTIADLPAALTHDRLLAQARALAALDKRDEALAAIASEKDSAAERLRASIYGALLESRRQSGRLIDEGDAGG
jgi:outer membrane PBP1 activator LpoA protein